MNVYFQRTHQRAFGTYPLEGDRLRTALEAALESGYRAIDTAQMYGNEADVGRTLAGCSVPRDELCLVTKVHPDNFSAASFLPSVERSLEHLQTDYVDVLLLHWPPVGGDVRPSLALLEEAQARGLARDVGVSNYNARMMREARAAVSGSLVTNQVEFHPLLDQSALLAAATETGIPLSAFSTVARGRVFEFPLFAEIGTAYGKSAGQIVLRWILQKGVAVTTMSTKPENIRQNFDVMDFTLSSVDMARIEALTRTNHRVVTADKVPWAPEWD